WAWRWRPVRSTRSRRGTGGRRWRSARSPTTWSPARRPARTSASAPSPTWSTSLSPRRSGRHEQALELAASGQVLGLDDPAAAHEVERRAHPLERYAGQLGPREAVERELELVGLVLPRRLPVHDQVALLLGV